MAGPAPTGWTAARARTTWPAAQAATPITSERYRHRGRGRRPRRGRSRVRERQLCPDGRRAGRVYGGDHLAGTGAINLTGNEFGNDIHGNNGVNVLAGKDGNDVLTGRGGADVFVFDTAPNNTTNRDIVADFNGTQDTIRLAKSAFAALTGNVGTACPPINSSSDQTRSMPTTASCTATVHSATTATAILPVASS